MTPIRHVTLPYLTYRDIEATRRRVIEFVKGDNIAAGQVLIVHGPGAKCVRVVTQVVPYPREDGDYPVAHLRTMTLLERASFNASERNKEAERLATLKAFHASE